MSKKIGYGLVFIIIICLLYIIIVPFFLKKEIEKRYSFVNIDTISYGIVNFELNNVKINKENINGSFDKVDIDIFNKTANVYGGHLDIKLEKNNYQKQVNKVINNKNIIKIYNIDLSVIGDDIQFVAHRVSYLYGYLLFDKAKLIYKEIPITLTKGRIGTLLKDFSIEKGNFTVEQPFYIPVSFTNIKGNINKKTLEVKSILSDNSFVFVILKDLKFKINEDNNYSIKIETAHLNNELIDNKTITLYDLELSVDKSLSNVKVRLYKSYLNINENYIEGDSPCENWVESLPLPTPPAIKQSINNFSGYLHFKINYNPFVKLEIRQNCKLKCSSPLIRDLFLNHEKYAYKAYRPDGTYYIKQFLDIDWQELKDISPNIGLALITLEDPGFMNHNGFSYLSLENSLRENVKLGKAFRGGSTITMQLAKNLWLTRDKTIMRKVHEFFLTTALESCLTKDQIIEHYLNLVEFGPNIHGIKAGKDYYFKNSSLKYLGLDKAVYLAMILPHPNHVIMPNDGGLNQATKLLLKLIDSGYIF